MGKRNKKSVAVFIDRDGTLIHEKHYLRKIKDVIIFADAVRSLKKLKKAGFKVILVTNQSGIGRGYLTENKLKQINAYIEKVLFEKGVRLDAVYYCPHVPEDNCECRKPKLGMVKKAEKRFKLDLKKSYVIGDHVNDFLLGKKMGGKGIFILTGHGKEEYEKISSGVTSAAPDSIQKNLASAANWILSDKRTVSKS